MSKLTCQYGDTTVTYNLDWIDDDYKFKKVGIHRMEGFDLISPKDVMKENLIQNRYTNRCELSQILQGYGDNIEVKWETPVETNSDMVFFTITFSDGSTYRVSIWHDEFNRSLEIEIMNVNTGEYVCPALNYDDQYFNIGEIANDIISNIKLETVFK